MERPPAGPGERNPFALSWSPVFQPEELAARLRLVVITDPDHASPRSVQQVVQAALEGGCRCIQLRDKSASGSELLEVASTLRALTRRFGALLIVNDRFDVALAAEADGVHVGPNDLPVAAIRARVPSSFLIGASCDRVEDAVVLTAAGADYLGCGTVYPTRTKPDAGAAIGVERLADIARAVPQPVVAIGGITPANVGALAASGASGIAVVGAVMGATDPMASVVDLLDAFGRR